jgi:glucosamine--fructose-6-phosphate aminotransferase (isomerizing)
METGVSLSPFPHWMLREIYEQPEMIERTLARFVDGKALRPEAWQEARAWLEATRGTVLILASGSSRHAGLVAEVLLEDLAGLTVDVEYASEFVYRSKNALKHASVLVISQSGETADTLAALRKATETGLQTLAITNVAESHLASEATVSLPTEAGRERAVPATKSFTAQLLNLYLLSLAAAEVRGRMGREDMATRLAELAGLADAVRGQLAGWQQAAERCARHYSDARSMLFLGRGLHYPIAREGALKLKESAYLHAEGYPSGELKHGPNALVGESTPLVMLATVDREEEESVGRYERVVALMEDMRRQGADVFAICNEDDERVLALAARSIQIRAMSEPLLAICEVIPLQLFSYFMAVLAWQQTFRLLARYKELGGASVIHRPRLRR